MKSTTLSTDVVWLAPTHWGEEDASASLAAAHTCGPCVQNYGNRGLLRGTPVPKNMLGAVPKLTPDEWNIIEDALSYSSLDGRYPSRQVIWFYCTDKVIRAIERYEHYEIAVSVAALKLKLALSR
jgi:hypothetical protein